MCSRLLRSTFTLAQGLLQLLIRIASEIAGMRNANLMSFVASTHRQDSDVLMYLERVITHMLRGTANVEDLLPDVWKSHHPEAIRTYRAEERRDKADTAIFQAAKRKLRCYLRHFLHG
jgi:hypothetical protein